MPGSSTNAELDAIAGPNQIWCGAGLMLGPDFGEILTPLLGGYVVLIFEYTKSFPATLDYFIFLVRNETVIFAKLC